MGAILGDAFNPCFGDFPGAVKAEFLGEEAGDSGALATQSTPSATNDGAPVTLAERPKASSRRSVSSTAFVGFDVRFIAVRISVSERTVSPLIARSESPRRMPAR